MIDHDCLMSWHDTILYVKENRLLLFHAINDGEMRNINFVICAIKNDIAFCPFLDKIDIFRKFMMMEVSCWGKRNMDFRLFLM